MKTRLLRLSLAALGGCMMAAANSLAQENVLEEIIVTAEKREASIQDTAMALTAVSGDLLESGGLDEIEDIALDVPSLVFSRAGGEAQLYIRGVGTNLFGIGQDSSVAVHQDGVYQGRAQMGLNQFLDVERVEVLRGPQGTLYGRNATAGVVNIIHRAPGDEPEGYVNLKLGNFDRYDGEAAYGGPIGEGAGFRLALRYGSDGGFTEDLDPTGGDEVDGGETMAARATLTFSLSDAVSAGSSASPPTCRGETDGRPKDVAWAARLSGLDAEMLRGLARRMADSRTMINMSWSLNRQDHGEQPFWTGAALAAMLGQIGLPGGGVAFGYAATSNMGLHSHRMRWAGLNPGPFPVDDLIPVSRIADMLLNPGAAFDFNGRRLHFPDVRLLYWLGGNPFHHHQDLNRLLGAWRRPETVVVHEPWWTPLARHADIALPATTPLERNDFVTSPSDPRVLAVQRCIAPYAESRNDFDILAGIADRLGCAQGFTEGRSETDWLRHLHDQNRQRAAEQGFTLPDFDTFWREGECGLPEREDFQVMHAKFRADPGGHRLRTPSGRIEIFSETIESFDYEDCPGHPAWMEPAEWLGSPLAERFPLHLVSNQPVVRLHSQYDASELSRAAKVSGREAIRLNPDDAGARGIAAGDVVRVFNDRGQCLAGAVLSDAVRPGVVQMATGAWFDPAQPGEIGSLCKHGSVNVLTLDKGTSRLAQGSSAHTCLVEVERYEGEPPPVTAFDPPTIERR